MNNDTHQPICPKCGYDQSGEIATWETQCPIEGVCTECGFEFQWFMILNPVRGHLRWFVEHSPTRRFTIKSSLLTLWMVLIPNRFWRRVGVERPVYPRRIWMWVCLLVMASYCISVLLGASIQIIRTDYMNQEYTLMMTQYPQYANQLKANLVDMFEFSYWASVARASIADPIVMTQSISQAGLGFCFVLLMTILMWFVVICATPITRQLVKLRLAHISRAMALCLIAPLIVLLTSNVSSGAIIIEGMLRPPTAVPSQGLEPTLLMLIGVLGAVSLVWVQWFWMAAYIKAWRVRSNLLLALAVFTSLLGGFTVFVYMLAY